MRKQILATVSTAALITALALSSDMAAAHLPAPHINIQSPVIEAAFLDNFKSGWNAIFHKKEKVKPTISPYYIHDKKTFQEYTHTVHIRPYNNQLLEFDISLPDKWTVNDTTADRTSDVGLHVIVDAVKFQSEMIEQRRITGIISLKRLAHESTAGVLLREYILSNSYALENNEVTEVDSQNASAYYTSFDNNGTLHTYISATITRDIMMLTRINIPLPYKERAKFIQKEIATSLQISYPSKESVERQKKFTLSDAAVFEHPASWTTLQPASDDANRLIVLLNNISPSGTVYGAINFLAIRRNKNTTLKKELTRQKLHFRKVTGLDINTFVKEHDIPDIKSYKKSRFIFSRYETYSAEYNYGHNKNRRTKTIYDIKGKSKPEVHLVVLGDEKWYIFLYMITPSKQDAPLPWAQNTRTFELILASIK